MTNTLNIKPVDFIIHAPKSILDFVHYNVSIVLGAEVIESVCVKYGYELDVILEKIAGHSKNPAIATEPVSYVELSQSTLDYFLSNDAYAEGINNLSNFKKFAVLQAKDLRAKKEQSGSNRWTNTFNGDLSIVFTILNSSQSDFDNAVNLYGENQVKLFNNFKMQIAEEASLSLNMISFFEKNISSDIILVKMEEIKRMTIDYLNV